MTLLSKIESNLTAAVKERDKLKIDTLRGLKASVLNFRIEKFSKISPGAGEEKKIEDGEIIKIIKSEIKKRKDSIEAYEDGGRQDLADKEKKEIDILREYIPGEMTDDQIMDFIKDKIEKKGGLTQKKFGPMMGEIVREIGDRADSKSISAILKKLLS